MVWWACAGLWAVALCVVVHYARRALVADVFVVPSESMQPTLLPGDRVKVDKTIFGARLYTSLDLADGRPLPYYRFRKNYYFVCGDMAYGSGDSRYWGFVPEEYIVGVVTDVVKSVDPATGRERKERRGLDLTTRREEHGTAV